MLRPLKIVPRHLCPGVYGAPATSTENWSLVGLYMWGVLVYDWAIFTISWQRILQLDLLLAITKWLLLEGGIIYSKWNAQILRDSSLNLTIAYTRAAISPIKMRTFLLLLKVSLGSSAANAEIRQPTLAAFITIFIHHSLFSLFWNLA